MVVLVTGASHTGKTVLAQKLLEKYGWPTLSLDLLKMGLIRSGQTSLTPEDDEELTGYLWPIVREIIKTAVENKQNLVVEGCYIPFDWQESFSPEYRTDIKYICLVLSEDYIHRHFRDIKAHASDVEQRLYDEGLTAQWLIDENAKCLSACHAYNLPFVLIDKEYEVPLEF